MSPEPDAEAIFEAVRKGAPPPRARDRGLSTRQLAGFFDASRWTAFDDSDTVRLSFAIAVAVAVSRMISGLLHALS